jgi:hypothetical protein
LENVRLALLGHVLFLALIIVALIFLEGRFEPVDDFAHYKPPSEFFLGILAGFAEKRVRDFTSSLFDRL